MPLWLAVRNSFKSPVVQVKNKMAQMGIYFYEIALEDVEFVNLLAS